MTRDMGYDTRQLLVVDADVPAHEDAAADYRRANQQFNGRCLPGWQRHRASRVWRASWASRLENIAQMAITKLRAEC